MRPKAVLLDIDGTLIDSNDSHAQAWVSALTEAGMMADFPTVRPLIGMGGDKLLPKVANIDADSPEGKAVSQRRQEIFQKEYLPLIRPFPRVRELLMRMKQADLVLAVASSAKAGELDSLLRLFDGEEFIDAKTTSDDVNNSKPDPDIVHVALGRLGRSTDEVLLLGDTPYDVEASLRAGIQMIALRCGGWGDSDLKGALAVYDDPADLLDHFEQSPFRGL